MSGRGIVAFVVLAVALASLAGGRPTGDAHAATICVKHTKRVVVHVKRHGKRTPVVRVRHYRTCRPGSSSDGPGSTTPGGVTPPSTSAPTPPGEAPAPPSGPPAGEPEPEANAIGVAADDHGGHKSYTLSRQTVRPGALTVQLNNKGEDPHDMSMQKVGPSGEPLGAIVEIPVTAPGEQKTKSVEVEPGRYRMWCNLYHHAEEGMEATITVE
ncbi:MAG: hypothetical protein JSU06_11170 [Actinobacteria bacterium]|nr:hypothetical protein [Actinomycetota bacterium]